MIRALLPPLAVLALPAARLAATKSMTQGTHRMELMLERLDGATWKTIDPALVLAQGDRVRFRFRTNFDGYLYVTNQSTSGKYEQLFPAKRPGQDNHIVAGKDYQVPATSVAFRIAGPPGHEVVYWLVSPGRLTDMPARPTLPPTGNHSAPYADSALRRRRHESARRLHRQHRRTQADSPRRRRLQGTRRRQRRQPRTPLCARAEHGRDFLDGAAHRPRHLRISTRTPVISHASSQLSRLRFGPGGVRHGPNASPRNQQRDLKLEKIEPPKPPSNAPAQSYAVIVGISAYPKLPAGLQLHFPERDAQSIYTALISPEGGNFKAENVKVLTGAKATLAASGRRSARGCPRWRKGDDRVVIYFAGHGFIYQGKAYLAPYPTSMRPMSKAPAIPWTNWAPPSAARFTPSGRSC
jgi:hypothetical protein